MAFEAGAISLGAIRTLFGGASPDGLAEYYRGAGYVVNAAPNLGVPTSGTISFSQFRGTSGTSPLTAGATPGSVSGNITVSGSGLATSGSTAVTPSGGTPGYTYSWAYLSGTSFTITSASSATTTFSYSHSTAGNPSYSGVYRCTVRDSLSVTVTVDVTVTLTFTDVPLVATLSSSYVVGGATAPSGSATATTSNTTLTASGGTGSYTSYAWTQTGGTTMTILNPSSATTAFRLTHAVAGDPVITGTFRCTVTDTLGHTAYADCTAELDFYLG